MRIFRPHRNFVGLILGGISLFFLAGCGSGKGGTDSGSINGGGNNPPLISGNASLASGVSVLDPASEGQIVTSDATSVTLTGMPSSLAGLKTGEIFVAQDTARKVVSIALQDGNTVIQTITPEFSEVFKTLQVSATVPLTDQYRVFPTSPSTKAQRSTSLASGVTITTERHNNTYTIQLTDSMLTGTIVLDQPQVDVHFNYGILSDQYASIQFAAGETVDLTLSSPVLSASLNQDLPLLEFQVPIPVTGGTVTVAISLVLHFQADGSAQLVTGIHQGLAYNAGITATLNPVTLTPSNSTTHDFRVIEPQFTGEINAVVAVNPDIDAQLLQYSLAGIANRLAVEASARATADFANVCSRFQATADLSSAAYVMLPNVALDLNFSWDTFFTGLDISMNRYTAELFRYVEPIYDSGDQCVVSNALPVADAGPDLTTNPNATVLLNGLGSNDPDGTLASYTWTQLDGMPITLVNATTATPSFSAPPTQGTLTLRLTVTDNNGASATDDLVVTVVSQPPPGAPAAPTGVSAAVGDGRVTLSWANVSGATSYNVYRASVSGVTPANYSTLPGGIRHSGVSSPFLEGGLTNDTTYYFVVTAENGAGESLPSGDVSASPHVGTPNIGTFTATGRMSTARALHTATLLPNGTVLVVGGFNNSGEGSLASAELYDQATGTFSATGSMSARRFDHTATLFPNGKVLIVGGIGIDVLASGEFYDPATGTFSPTGSLGTGRYLHTATLLSGGKVLIVGGQDSSNNFLVTAELYDPATDTFSPAESMGTGRLGHTATLLSNGKVLIAGGVDINQFLASAEIYDPVIGTFTPTGSMNTAHTEHTATRLSNGKVLIAGGFSGSASPASAEVYDPATGTFSPTGTMSTPYGTHTATLLSNGMVLIAGGAKVIDGYLATAELYDPAIGNFSPTGTMSTARGAHTAIRLSNGTALIAGGRNGDGNTILASAELYSENGSGATTDIVASDFVGTWVNNDPNTNGTTRIIIDQNGSTMTIHGYGKCVPTDCDWGSIAVTYTGNPFIAVYEFGFKTDTLTLQLVSKSSLHVHSVNVFHDGTYRDYEADEYFHE